MLWGLLRHGESMLKDVIENAVWTKTQALIQEKYGKKIEFKTLNLTNPSASFYLKGDDLIIPLNSRSINLGEVIVNRGSLLDGEQKNEVIDLVKFLIEPHVYHKHLKLREEIELYKKQKSTEINNDNVYSLFSETDDLIVKLISSVIHLKSTKTESIKKVALKIHEMAEQDLFISFKEITQQIQSIDDLVDFNKTTFFISDISSLTPEELSLLSEFSSVKFPGLLFIIGSNLSASDIDQLAITTALKNDLLGIQFDIDRVPISQQTSEDVLELLFFNVDQIGSS